MRIYSNRMESRSQWIKRAKKREEEEDNGGDSNDDDDGYDDDDFERKQNSFYGCGKNGLLLFKVFFYTFVRFNFITDNPLSPAAAEAPNIKFPLPLESGSVTSIQYWTITSNSKTRS